MTAPPLSIIVAVDSQFGIGKDNHLLFHISEDLKRFRKLTTGHVIIMGRKTFESLPNGPLPQRKHIILTQKKNYSIPGCLVVNDITEVLENCDDQNENFVIGGGAIYKLLLPYVRKLYLTQIDSSKSADTYFPSISEDEWLTEDQTEWKRDENSGLCFRYHTLNRK